MEAAVVGAVAGVGSGIVGGPTVGAAVGLVSGALTVAVKSWMTVPTPAAEEEPQKKPKKKFVKPEPKVEEPEEEEKEKGLSAGQKRRLLEKKKKDDAKAKEEEAKKAAAAAKKAGKGKNAKGGKAEAKDNKPELAAAGSPAIKGASAPAQKAAAAAPAKSNAAPPAKTSAAEPAAEDAKKKKKKKKSAAAAKPEEAGDGGAFASSSSGADVVVTGADEWQQQPSQLREAKRGALAAAKREKADAAKAATGAAAISEAIEVPSKDHAAIIGKGGQMVRDLMAATGTKITVPRKESGQQFITVEGDKPNIERVRKAIKQIIATGLSDETHPGHVQNAIEIPASASGLLVGSKGETRKLLEDRLGVKITVPEKDENSKTALIKLQGPDAEVENAKAEIRRLVEDGFNSYVNPNWVKLQVVFPQTHLKHLFGAKGQALKDLQIATKTKINVPPKGERQTGPYANTVIITIVGPPTGVQDAREEMSKTAAIVEEDMTPVLLDPEPAWAGPSANLSAQNEW